MRMQIKIHVRHCSVTTHQVERNQENKQLSIASQWHMAIVKLWLQRVTCTTRMNGWLLLLALLLVRNKGKIRYTVLSSYCRQSMSKQLLTLMLRVLVCSFYLYYSGRVGNQTNCQNGTSKREDIKLQAESIVYVFMYP